MDRIRRDVMLSLSVSLSGTGGRKPNPTPRIHRIIRFISTGNHTHTLRYDGRTIVGTPPSFLRMDPRQPRQSEGPRIGITRYCTVCAFFIFILVLLLLCPSCPSRLPLCSSPTPCPLSVRTEDISASGYPDLLRFTVDSAPSYSLNFHHEPTSPTRLGLLFPPPTISRTKFPDPPRDRRRSKGNKKKKTLKPHSSQQEKRIDNHHKLPSTKSLINRKMRDMSSKFIEILDPNDTRPRMSDCDVRLEDVLADHEALVTRPRSSTQSSSKPSLDNRLDRDAPTSPTQRWKRLSTILVPARRGST
ncbi:uncharacterized protein BO96DRAFT_343572 [Aspergillus niger CBS 101883]|uniref:Contig An14c0180, genomic contig n=2 Tax=Aspergillus niger TaxID=5061 RepID=A2R3V0_ASPNC|nr:uncharacterized protein BO96DRAFT_343572 [Aspergillus niger CBS 101883]XP_059602364.1 uncharacterized protein An14g05570 [Aspergillus niger]PYH54091.1 hypothetical protein BO96DRAFT_343572 [Aspergillus niger CBS 101883]CAK42118.1 unnamed protein product [Aspergillus niger]